MVIFGYEEQVGEFFVPNGTSPDLIKKMKTKDLIDELQRFADFKMAMKEGGLITNYKKDLRKP